MKSWQSKYLKNLLKFIFIKYIKIIKLTYRDNKETLKDTRFYIKIIYYIKKLKKQNVPKGPYYFKT